MLTSLPQVSEIQQADLPQPDWCTEAAKALIAAGLEKDALEFLDCGKRFVVDICIDSPDHQPRIVPFSCHKRFCEECEHREHARKMARYVPVINDAVNFAPRGYSLKHLVLTTPFDLRASDSPEKVEIAWLWCEQALEKIYFTALDQRHKLSKSEKRRGRADLKAHKIGDLVSMEFGEVGHKLHFHIVTLSPYLPIKTLITPIWQEVSSNVCEVDWVKRVDDVEDGLQEVTKYVTKFTELPAELVPNLANCIKGVRRVRAHGVFYGAPVPPPIEKMVCETCGLPRRLVSPTEYIHRCEQKGVRLNDEIVRRAESYFIQELEISSGKFNAQGPAPPN